jgi:hypothetical protein
VGGGLCVFLRDNTARGEMVVPHPLRHTDTEVVAVQHDAIATRKLVRRQPATSASFTREQRDRAYRAAVERYVAWARELLDDTPSVLDNDVIRERRVEAARAVLDVLWAVMVERNLTEGLPHPVPGLSWHLDELGSGQLALSASS